MNGIDVAGFDPATDKRIAANYTVDDRGGKAVCKAKLQEELGLEVRDDRPLMVMVTRLTRQKGMDLVMYALDRILAGGVQVAVLGTGDRDYEDGLRYFQDKYPGTMAARIEFDPALSQRMYAAADMFLMPSKFEPCGLSQIIAMRYGTLPIVRETGGLKDTVIPYNEFTGEGTGFSFSNFNGDEMGDAVFRAARLFWDNREAWNQLVTQAMSQDFSWTRSADKYLDLYFFMHPEIERPAAVAEAEPKAEPVAEAPKAEEKQVEAEPEVKAEPKAETTPEPEAKPAAKPAAKKTTTRKTTTKKAATTKAAATKTTAAKATTARKRTTAAAKKAAEVEVAPEAKTEAPATETKPAAKAPTKTAAKKTTTAKTTAAKKTAATKATTTKAAATKAAPKAAAKPAAKVEEAVAEPKAEATVEAKPAAKTTTRKRTTTTTKKATAKAAAPKADSKPEVKAEPAPKTAEVKASPKAEAKPEPAKETPVSPAAPAEEKAPSKKTSVRKATATRKRR